MGRLVSTDRPIGHFIELGTPSIPTGYLPCDGSAVSRTTYKDLFDALGGVASPFGLALTSHPAGTHFNLPDSRGRTLVSDGTGIGLSTRTVGQAVGAEVHTLSVAETPSHRHAIDIYNGTQVGSGHVSSYAVRDPNGQAPATDMQAIGGGGSHNNVQPSLVVKRAIKY